MLLPDSVKREKKIIAISSWHSVKGLTGYESEPGG